MTSPALTVYLISRLYYAARSKIDSALADLGITSVQYTVLSLLRGRDHLSSADIARRYFVKPQSMNQIIFSLERLDLIVRNADPDNRRILRVQLTEKGTTLLAACDERINRIEGAMLDGLSPEQVEAFRATGFAILRNSYGRGEADS